jgi:hypothetical protein
MEGYGDAKKRRDDKERFFKESRFAFTGGSPLRPPPSPFTHLAVAPHIRLDHTDGNAPGNHWHRIEWSKRARANLIWLIFHKPNNASPIRKPRDSI